MSWPAAAVFSVGLMCAHAAAQGGGEGATARQFLAEMPSTYTGTMPCADCPGIRYQLNLNPDHTFASRMIYEERNTSFDDSGSWEMNGAVLALKGKQGGVQKYAVRDANTLRQLDANGNEIGSKLNYDLKRAQNFISLEAQSGSKDALEGTEWKLVELDGSPVQPGPREAFILFDSTSHRVSGSGGCNRLMGSYETKGSQLKFGEMAGTRMACAQGMEAEQAFLKALSQVSTWKIAGGHLELFDGGGKMLARFAGGE
jgi:copper homeostasis protein (lipoprotein)